MSVVTEMSVCSRRHAVLHLLVVCSACVQSTWSCSGWRATPPWTPHQIDQNPAPLPRSLARTADPSNPGPRASSSWRTHLRGRPRWRWRQRWYWMIGFWCRHSAHVCLRTWSTPSTCVLAGAPAPVVQRQYSTGTAGVMVPEVVVDELQDLALMPDVSPLSWPALGWWPVGMLWMNEKPYSRLVGRSGWHMLKDATCCNLVCVILGQCSQLVCYVERWLAVHVSILQGCSAIVWLPRKSDHQTHCNLNTAKLIACCSSVLPACWALLLLLVWMGRWYSYGVHYICGQLPCQHDSVCIHSATDLFGFWTCSFVPLPKQMKVSWPRTSARLHGMACAVSMRASQSLT